MCVASLPQIPIKSIFGTFAGCGDAAALDAAVGLADDPVGVGGAVALTLGGGVVVMGATDARGDGDSSGTGGLPLHPALYPASPQAIALHTALRMGVC
jgi:hypothetical protein